METSRTAMVQDKVVAEASHPEVHEENREVGDEAKRERLPNDVLSQ